LFIPISGNAIVVVVNFLLPKAKNGIVIVHVNQLLLNSLNLAILVLKPCSAEFKMISMIMCHGITTRKKSYLDTNF